MSAENMDTATSMQPDDGDMLTAEYKDGQLQIVEVTPFDKTSVDTILPDAGNEGNKYLQVMDDDKGLMHLDLLNFTLVKCLDTKDGEAASYQLVDASNSDDGEPTLTCVLSGEIVDLEPQRQEQELDTYVMVDTEEGKDPLVFLQSTLQQIHTQQSIRKGQTGHTKVLTPTEILQKAKALQKAKNLLSQSGRRGRGARGRRANTSLPTPMQLLSSPNFKLFLYSCKMCNFKCNAIKEMTAHKAQEHFGGSKNGVRGSGRAPLQCARCPHRADSQAMLAQHVKSVHESPNQKESPMISMESSELDNADVLVCGACGFESGERATFAQHIHQAHGVNLLIKPEQLQSTHGA